MLPIIPWILTIVLYAPVFRQLYTSRWEAIDYTHAYFILPVTLFVTWTKRKEIQRFLASSNSHPTFYAPGFALLLFGLASFILGWRWDYLFIQTFSLIPLLFGLCLFLYNKDLAKTLSFPILYLLLLVPMPIGILDAVTLPMRSAVSYMSAHILTAMNYDIVREGLLIKMGGHQIFMGAPCSGFRSLITMMSLGLVYIYFCKGTLVKNIILFIAIIPLALIGNLIRVITLCLITYHFGDEAGQGFFHDFSGMVVFLIIIFGLMGLEKLLNTDKQRRGA